MAHESSSFKDESVAFKYVCSHGDSGMKSYDNAMWEYTFTRDSL